MHKSLQDIKVLVTRPAPQADNLCDLIESNGGQAIRLPTIDIQPPDNKEKVIQLLDDLSMFQIGIFVSKNAVQRTLSLCEGMNNQLQKLTLIAMGAMTAEELLKSGVGQPVYAKGQADSESLLDLPELQGRLIKDKSIIIFRGQGGRELLATTLRTRGANVEYAEVYKRTCPHYERSIIDNIWHSERPDMIVITSCEALQNLFDMLNSAQREILLHKQLVTIGKRIVDLARILGFKEQIFIADETSDTGILNAIKKSIGTTV
jgi:uroporphyrinogen-III synthase